MVYYGAVSPKISQYDLNLHTKCPFWVKVGSNLQGRSNGWHIYKPNFMFLSSFSFIVASFIARVCFGANVALKLKNERPFPRLPATSKTKRMWNLKVCSLLPSCALSSTSVEHIILCEPHLAFSLYILGIFCCNCLWRSFLLKPEQQLDTISIAAAVLRALQ